MNTDLNAFFSSLAATGTIAVISFIYLWFKGFLKLPTRMLVVETLVTTYTSLPDRTIHIEQQQAQLDRRMERLEVKIDALQLSVNQMAQTLALVAAHRGFSPPEAPKAIGD